MSTSRKSRAVLLCAVAGAALAAFPRLGLAQQEFANFFEPTYNGANNYEATFLGNDLDYINISDSNQAGYNPFLNGSVTDSYNATSDTTTVVWSGTAGPPWANGAGGTVHFGLQGVPGGPFLEPSSLAWTDNSTVVQRDPAIDVGTSGNDTQPATEFLTVFVEQTDTTTNLTDGFWLEFPWNPVYTPTLTLSNPTGDPLSFTDFGFMLSPTEIPLSDLNFGSEPPPGMPGSNFTQLPDPSSLPADGSEQADVPEPATLGLSAVFACGLLIRRRKTT